MLSNGSCFFGYKATVLLLQDKSRAPYDLKYAILYSYHTLKIWPENETQRQEKKESIEADPKMTQSWNSDDKLAAMNIPKELELHSVAVVIIK